MEQTDKNTDKQPSDVENKSSNDSQSSDDKNASDSSSDIVKPINAAVNDNHLKSSTSAENVDNMQSIYYVKWISWRNERTPIVTQNENGPCPLLAIFNVLLLSKKITLGEAVEIISSNQITAYVADVIWENMPKELPDEERLNYEQNVSDALSVFPNLQTGLDVNVKFSGVSSFEYTPELTVFDLLRIPLYHGWLVDPQDREVSDIIGNNSYNEIVEKIVNYSSSNNETTVTKGLIAKEFLESSASQITCYGIASLCEEVSHGDLAVLFRNNHFSTLYRHKDELFTLITDLGFLRESQVVWETLSSIHGDSSFVDSNFLNSPPKEETDASPATQNTSHDYQLALSLQQQGSESVSASNSTDYELAVHLQEMEVKQQRSSSSSALQPRPQTAGMSMSRSGVGANARRPNSAPNHLLTDQDNSKCSIL